MKTDAEIKCAGIQALMANLGRVDAERFVALLSREPFDYTLWQRDLWPEKTAREISALSSPWNPCELGRRLPYNAYLSELHLG